MRLARPTTALHFTPSSLERTMACEDAFCFVYSFLGRLLAYFAILAVLVMISAVIAKCIGDWKERNMEQAVERGENSPLMNQRRRHYSDKIASLTSINYGACHQDDVEYGSSSSSSNNVDNICSSSSNSTSRSNNNSGVCVICYTHQRNCFFVPCGHFATCHSCAYRIFYEESRHCPICRRFIGKLRRLCDS